MKTIREAVDTQRQEVINLAKNKMLRLIESHKANLIEADMKYLEYAPSPVAGRDSNYKEKSALHRFVRRIVTTGNSPRMVNEEAIATGFNEDGIRLLVEQAGKEAEQGFEAYIKKLESKVGEYDSVEYFGDLFSFSVLKVTKNGVSESWKTQMIMNVSKYGKLFNQYPTRKVK
jgi:sigma54-dependent transcription regulator